MKEVLMFGCFTAVRHLVFATHAGGVQPDRYHLLPDLEYGRQLKMLNDGKGRNLRFSQFLPEH